VLEGGRGRPERGQLGGGGRGVRPRCGEIGVGLVQPRTQGRAGLLQPGYLFGADVGDGEISHRDDSFLDGGSVGRPGGGPGKAWPALTYSRRMACTRCATPMTGPVPVVSASASAAARKAAATAELRISAPGRS